MKKEGEEAEKEQEKLGKLEFSLDYNFTDSQVAPLRHKPVRVKRNTSLTR